MVMMPLRVQRPTAMATPPEALVETEKLKGEEQKEGLPADTNEKEDQGQKEKGRPGLECSVCGRKFSRPSHRDRHCRTHLPPDRRQSIPCGQCGKMFGRNDVLLRHLRAAHQFDPGPKQTAQKSCNRCVQLRRKCDRAQPCRLCAAGGEVCSYPVTKDPAAAAATAATATLESVVSPREKQMPTTATTTTTTMTITAAIDAYTTPESDANNQTPMPLTADRGEMFGGGRLEQPASLLGAPSFLSPDAAAQRLSHTSPPFNGEYFYQSTDTAFAPGALDFRSTCVDWLEFNVPGLLEATEMGEAGEAAAAVHAASMPMSMSMPEGLGISSFASIAASPAPSMSAVSPSPSSPAGLPAPSTTLASFNTKSQVPALASAAPGTPASPAGHLPMMLAWPFEQEHDLAPHRHALPPLREVLQRSLGRSSPGAGIGSGGSSNSNKNGYNPSNSSMPRTCTSSGSSSSMMTSLALLVSEARLPALDEVTDAGMVQTAGYLKRLVDYYITRFHPILPLLHVPTWDMAACPSVLVATMACVGSLLSDDEHGAELAYQISDICMRMITWMGSADSANYRDIYFLSALCVHQIYSLGSGHRQLYQNADRTRGVLVGSLRGLGCLATRLGVEPEGRESEPAATAYYEADPRAQHVQWLAWVVREREKRTAWSSFEYDCSLSTLTGRRGAVDLSELPRLLPCVETLWEAPSAHAWGALRARLHPDAMGVPFSRVLQAALDSNGERNGNASTSTSTSAPLHTSFWGKRLCAQMIGRLLWDLKQLEALSTAEYFGLASLSTAQAESKARLLRALDSLLVALDQPATAADLISYNIASLICHYSHLYTADDTLDMILYIVRNTVSSADTADAGSRNGLRVAKHRLAAALARDPREARRLTWHAAQIVAVANDYLVSAPCEIMRLFMGCIFLIAFSTYCSPSQRAGGRPGMVAIQLDLPSHRVPNRDGIRAWIASGGPASIGSVDNIFAPGAPLMICRDAQAMLQRLKNWGLAEKFAKILQCFELKELG